MPKIKVGYYIDHETQRRLKLLADEDRRTASAELAWLVEQERRRRRDAQRPAPNPPGSGDVPSSSPS